MRALTTRAGLACLLALTIFVAAVHAKPSARGLEAGERKDRQALLALKAAIATNGFGNSKIRSWKQKGSACLPKPWSHVECNQDGRVTGLNLANLNIQGTLPPKLRDLNELEVLNMNGNKFSGTLPNQWSDRRYFRSLKTLNLGDNEMYGTLPNRRWNKKNGFRNLDTLDLSNNKFHGGLPDGWHSTNKVFAKLKFLDLSGNQLGFLDNNGAPGAESVQTGDWCQAAPQELPDANTLGWCPTATPIGGTMPNLVTLDLSGNKFAGELPKVWARMFPALQYLQIQNNRFYSWTSNLVTFPQGQPAALPDEWTSAYSPVGFPSLLTLTLYPGNENICFLPNVEDFAQDGFVDLNTDSTYSIEDDQQEEYDSGTPFLCPGAAESNPVSSVAVSKDNASGKIKVTFVKPSEAKPVYGYKVSLYEADPNAEDSDTLVDGWNGKILRVYENNKLGQADLPDDVLSLDLASSPVALVTKVAAKPGIAYRAEVVTFNVDGSDAQPIQAKFTAA